MYPTGFFRAKTKSLLGMARMVDEDFDGEVPTELDDLVKLPGVGRKTGNVVRSVAFDLPGLPVDTHVGRLSRRLKLTTEDDPVKVETDLNVLVPPEERGRFSLRLILHGRQVCFARKPNCWALRARRHLPLGRPERPRPRPTAPASPWRLRGLERRKFVYRSSQGVVGALEGATGGEERALGLVELGDMGVGRCRGSGHRGRRPAPSRSVSCACRLESSARSDDRHTGQAYDARYRAMLPSREELHGCA